MLSLLEVRRGYGSDVALPGHTPGSQGILVQTDTGPLCYAGDLVLVTENMQELTPVGLHTDLAAAERSRQKVAALGMPVVPAHDARLFTGGEIQKLAP